MYLTKNEKKSWENFIITFVILDQMENCIC